MLEDRDSHASLLYLQQLGLPCVSVLRSMAEAGLAWTTTNNQQIHHTVTLKKSRTHQLQSVNMTESVT